jgi:hypothetical protein
MSAHLAKFAPIGLVAGAMGYFCWSHFEEAAPAAPASGVAKPIEMTAALLKPPAAPELNRDPFMAHDAPRPAEATHAAAGLRAPSPPGPLLPGEASRTGASAVGGRATTHGADITGELVLSGTYVRGNRRMAVINGSIYSQGDRIASSTAGSNAVTVARVDVDRVMLRLDRGTTELLYSVTAQSKEDRSRRPAGPSDRDAAKKLLSSVARRPATLHSRRLPRRKQPTPGSKIPKRHCRPAPRPRRFKPISLTHAAIHRH